MCAQRLKSWSASSFAFNMDVVKVRAIKKMLLTKAIHKAERQMDDRDVDSLNKTMSELATLFDDFDRAQDSYVSSLEDSDRIEAAELYYDNVCALYRHSKMHCISFLTGDTGPTENKTNMVSLLRGRHL